MSKIDMHGGYGFIYYPSNHRLSHSYDVEEGGVLLLKADYPGSNNEDNIFVCCDNCKTQMEFIKDISDPLKNHWVCQHCGAKVKESSVFNQLQRENEKYLKDNGLNGYNDDDYDEYYGYLG